jgi:hypothetical protein
VVAAVSRKPVSTPLTRTREKTDADQGVQRHEQGVQSAFSPVRNADLGAVGVRAATLASQ